MIVIHLLRRFFRINQQPNIKTLSSAIEWRLQRLVICSYGLKKEISTIGSMKWCYENTDLIQNEETTKDRGHMPDHANFFKKI